MHNTRQLTSYGLIWDMSLSLSLKKFKTITRRFRGEREGRFNTKARLGKGKGKGETRYPGEFYDVFHGVVVKNRNGEEGGKRPGAKKGMDVV